MHIIGLVKKKKKHIPECTRINDTSTVFYHSMNVHATSWRQHHKLVATPKSDGSTSRSGIPTTYPWFTLYNQTLHKPDLHAIIWRQHHKLVASLNKWFFHTRLQPMKLLFLWFNLFLVRSFQCDYPVGDFSVKWWSSQYLLFVAHVFYILLQTGLFVL